MYTKLCLTNNEPYQYLRMFDIWGDFSIVGRKVFVTEFEESVSFYSFCIIYQHMLFFMISCFMWWSLESCDRESIHKSYDFLCSLHGSEYVIIMLLKLFKYIEYDYFKRYEVTYCHPISSTYTGSIDIR